MKTVFERLNRRGCAAERQRESDDAIDEWKRRIVDIASLFSRSGLRLLFSFFFFFFLAIRISSISFCKFYCIFCAEMLLVQHLGHRQRI